MAPAHHKPLMLLSATRPTFHTMTQLLHTLKQLPLCNSQTQPPGLVTSDVPLLNLPLLLQRISKTGYSQAPFDCTPILSINFLGPILLISLPSLKAISSATSAWINSSPSCPHILPILRLCRPPSSNLEHLNAPKLRLHRSHANPLHVVPLPLLLLRIPCHHIPTRPLLSLTLQVSRSLLRILSPPPPSTLSPLRSPPSLTLRYRYLTPLLVVAPPAGTQTPFSQNSYQAAIPLGSNDQGLPRSVPRAPLLFVPLLVPLESRLTQMNTGILETTILLTLTLPKAKAKVKAKAKARKGRVKDQAKEKANLKVKKIVPLPLPPLFLPPQQKEKARNNHTTHPPPLLPFKWLGLSLWQVPPPVLSVISTPSAHPTGPACHCGRSRRVPNTPNPLPSHHYTHPSVSPTHPHM